jgi:hypothetical protein
MAALRLRRSNALILLISVVVHFQGCRESNPVETVSVSLRNTETFEYPTLGGDEEGASISTQAEHYSVSEIRRGAETNWVAVYVYRPVEGYVGSDYAELELRSSSTGGANSPTRIWTVAFRFSIHD